VPTDVTSFHVDSALVEVDTWLCTYLGACSEGLANEDARRKIESPEIRELLLREYGGRTTKARGVPARAQARLALRAAARGAALRLRTLRPWRIATRWPGSPVPPCVHRAPVNRPARRAYC
jgi:hypothetical protein